MCRIPQLRPFFASCAVCCAGQRKLEQLFERALNLDLDDSDASRSDHLRHFERLSS